MTNLLCYCDKCGKSIDRKSNFEHQNYNLCSECALALYQKIYGNDQENNAHE